MQLLCILPFGILSLFAIRMMFLKIVLAVCMLVGVSSRLSCSLYMFTGFVAVYSHVVC